MSAACASSAPSWSSGSPRLARHSNAGRELGGALFGHGEPDDRLLLGVEYADGRTGSNLGGFRGGLDPQLDPATPVLMPGDGGAGPVR